MFRSTRRKFADRWFEVPHIREEGDHQVRRMQVHRAVSPLRRYDPPAPVTDDCQRDTDIASRRGAEGGGEADGAYICVAVGGAFTF